MPGNVKRETDKMEDDRKYECDPGPDQANPVDLFPVHLNQI